MDRYEGAPIQMDPRQIMPEARSMIVVAFRVMRGSLRGIEEGTFFSNYSAMGYGGITYLFMPLTVMNLCRYIEDHGYEAIPIGHQSDWRAIDGKGNLKPNFSRPVAPGRANPDVMIHLRDRRVSCWPREIGYSKVFLTPQFGPDSAWALFSQRQSSSRIQSTTVKLCNRCMACVRECPGSAISATKTVKVELAGNLVEWGELDCDACDLAFRGGMKGDGEYIEGWREGTVPSSISPFYKNPAISTTPGRQSAAAEAACAPA